MQSGDTEMSCEELDKGIETLDKNIKQIKSVKTRKVGTNTILYVLAIPTLFLSLLLIDSADNDQDQIGFYEKRIVHLGQIRSLNDCQMKE
jgi:hypothetical protein